MFGPAENILKDVSLSPKERLIKFYEYRVKTLQEDLKLQKGCMACNLGNEVGEHNENIRGAVLKIHKKTVQSIVNVGLEAQEAGEIDASINVKDLIEFIEDAGKGAMVSMKEMKSSYPIKNFLKMVKAVLLK